MSFRELLIVLATVLVVVGGLGVLDDPRLLSSTHAFACAGMILGLIVLTILGVESWGQYNLGKVPTYPKAKA